MSKEFIDAEMRLFAEQAKEVNIIITTAAIPGKKSPVLITKEMVESMIPGSVIVDLAAEGGGNCEMTIPGEFRVYKKVTIIGFTDLPSRLPTQASQLFSNNTAKLIQHLNVDGELNLDLEDEITGAITVVHDGKVLWDPEAQNKVQKKTVAPVKLETVSEKISEFPEVEKKKWSLLKMIGWLSGFCFGSSDWIWRFFRIHFPCNSICSRLFYRIHGDLECLAFITYTADECHQCDQWNNCDWGDDTSFRRTDHLACHCSPDCLYKHCRRFSSNSPNAGNVSKIIKYIVGCKYIVAVV